MGRRSKRGRTPPRTRAGTSTFPRLPSFIPPIPPTHPTPSPVIYNVTHTPPLKIPAFWGLIFFVTNGTMILSLLLEDQEIAFSKVRAFLTHPPTHPPTDLTPIDKKVCSLLLLIHPPTYSQEELSLFEEHFLPYSLTPTQFRKLLGKAKWKDVPAG